MEHETKVPFDPRTYLAQAGDGRTIFKRGPNEVIFSQGDRADAAFYVQNGRVKITALSRGGKEAMLQILGTGDFLGLSCLIGQTQRLIAASTITECRITRLEKALITRMLKQEPKFSEFVMSFLLTRTMQMQEDLIDHLFNSSERRLARTLLLLANFGKDGPAENVIPHVTQEMLADMIGTTRPRVNVFMNKFRNLRFIDYNGEIRVHRSLLDVVLHD